MASHLRRLRAGEYVTAAGVVALLLALFVLAWSASGAAAGATRDGWHALPAVRWLLLVLAGLGAGVVAAQAVCRAPAIPACLDTVTTVLALIGVVWVLVDVATGSGQRAGAWVGLAAVCAIEAGSFLALRQEGILEADGPQHIPVVGLAVRRSRLT